MYAILKATGYPVTEDEFPENFAVSMPYITFAHSGTANFIADGKVFKKIQDFDIYLHIDGKRRDPAAQNVLEAALDAAEVLYDEIDAFYNEEEGHFIVQYEATLWRE